ncbi:MAG: hypothetical protein ACKO01_03760 [Erythrobacter sp.]
MTFIQSTIDARALGKAQNRDWLETWQAFVVLHVIAVLPLLLVGFPPLVDLYGHLGRYAVQTDLQNRPELQQFFSYDWTLIGNLGADLLVQALHGWLGLEASVRLIVILSQLLATSAVLLVSREIHGRITPFALAALPLNYSMAFSYGFINYTLSMTLALLAFVGWMRLRRRGHAVAARVFLAGAGMVVWVSHAYGWAFLGLLCGATVLAEVIAARHRPVAAVTTILAECCPLLLPLVPMVLWRSGSGGLDTMGWTIGTKLQGLASVFRNKWPSLDIPSVFVILCLIYWAIRDRSAAFDKRMGLAAVLCLACFILLPNRVFGSIYADIRLTPYLLMTALLAISPARIDARTMKRLTLIALAFFEGRTVITAAAYIDHEETVAEVLPTLDAIPRGARLAYFLVVPCTEDWDLPVLSHVPGVGLARKDIFANTQWQIAGTNALVVHYPAAAPFEHDPSQYVYAGKCEPGVYPTLAEVVSQFPHPGFTHLWIVDDLPKPLNVPQGLKAVPHAGKGVLYEVASPASPAPKAR